MKYGDVAAGINSLMLKVIFLLVIPGLHNLFPISKTECECTNEQKHERNRVVYRSFPKAVTCCW